MTSQTLSLNLIPKGISPRLYVSQYDKGQEWNFEIYAGAEVYTIPSESSVTIQGTKPDKTGFQYACSFSGNRVTATEQQQMTILAGEVPAEIRIEKNNEIIATLNFIIVVEKAALADDTVISETELPLIEEAIEVLGHADELVNQIQGYATTAQNAASTATTKASQASTSATNASNSATTASNAATTATNKASEATTAASTATTKASQASTSATSAAGSASTATTKAQEAAASAAAAAQSAAHLTIDGEMSTTSENALQNKVVTSAIQNLSNQVKYNTDNGVKNLFKIDIDRIKSNNKDSHSSWSGNTYTLYSGTFAFTDDSITFGGTPTANAYMNIDVDATNIPPAKYMLSGFSSITNVIVGHVTLYSSGTVVKSYSLATKNNSELDFTDYTYDTVRFEIKRNANNVAMSGTAKPMLCRKDLWDADNTYENYAEPNSVLTQKTTGLITNLNANGCKNLCVIANRAGTTHNSVTWAVADDDAITCDGTVPSGKWSNFPLGTLKLKKGVTYRINMKTEGTQTGTGNPYLTLNQGSSAVFTGRGTYTPTADITVTVQLNVSPTIQVTTSAKYYVLVCRESDYQLSPEFNLGAKSNRQLTEDVATINGHGYTLLGNGNAITNNTTFPAEQMTNVQCYADTVLRRAAVRVSALVSSKALTKGSATGVCNCYNGYIAKDPVMSNVGYAEKDGNIYLFLLSKNTSNNVIALTPLEDIPIEATFRGTLEWYY